MVVLRLITVGAIAEGMTNMVAEHKFKTVLAYAPTSWKYTSELFKAGFIGGWSDQFFTIDECIAKGTNYIKTKTKK